MRHLRAVAFLFPLLLILVGCNRTALTTQGVQRAVDQALDWTKKSGKVEVVGIQELPQENAARADIRFDGFQYNADMAGTPISKSQEAPRKPDMNSPNYWDEVYKYGTQQTRVGNYSGQGVGILKHYSDGRWMLTGVQFNLVEVNANVEIQ